MSLFTVSPFSGRRGEYTLYIVGNYVQSRRRLRNGVRRLFLKWGDRLKNIIGDMGGIGWGVYDYMEEEYMKIPWVKNKKQ